MKPSDLFVIILKIFGIYLIKDALTSILILLDTLVKYFGLDSELGLFSLFIALIILCFKMGLVYLLLFKTRFLISKLKLTAELSEEPLKLNMHRSSIYAIAIIISGLLVLVFAIPTFIQHLYYWYRFMDTMNNFYNYDNYFNFSGLLVSLSEVVIGFLFLGNQRAIVNFIELRTRKIDKPIVEQNDIL